MITWKRIVELILYLALAAAMCIALYLSGWPFHGRTDHPAGNKSKQMLMEDLRKTQ